MEITKKKKTLTLVLCLAMVLSVFVAPTCVFASNSADDVDITMKDDGSIEIGGSNVDFNSANSSSAWTELYQKYKKIIVGFSGVATLTMLAGFIILLTKLGVVSDNEQSRRRVIIGLLFTGLATMGLGSVTMLLGFFYNAL